MVDLLPTFLDAAGAKAPQDYVVDGVSLMPLLEGKRLRERSLYWWMPLYDLRWLGTPCAVVRRGRYKLIEYFGDYAHPVSGYVREPRIELYDLDADIGETRDLASTKRSVAESLRKELHGWIQRCGQEIPRRNPHYDPVRALEEVRATN
jgi:arylsulfatase A-like enzyme